MPKWWCIPTVGGGDVTAVVESSLGACACACTRGIGNGGVSRCMNAEYACENRGHLICELQQE